MLYFLFILLYIYICLCFYLLCFLNICASIPYLDTSWPQNEGELTSRGSSIQLGITFLIFTKRGRSNINSYVKSCFYKNLWFNEFRFCNHQKGEIVDIKTLFIFLNISLFWRSQNVKTLNVKLIWKQVIKWDYIT